MLDSCYLKNQTTVKEVEARTLLDVTRDLYPELFINDAKVIDKNSWYTNSAFQNNAKWIAFKNLIQEGDELWIYEIPRERGTVWTSFTGSKGVAIVRNGDIVNTFGISP